MVPRVLVLALIVGTLAGCVNEAARPTSRSSSTSSPQVRCLNDPNESGTTRPMFFLFCMQSP